MQCRRETRRPRPRDRRHVAAARPPTAVREPFEESATPSRAMNRPTRREAWRAPCASLARHASSRIAFRQPST
ncbi:hypothetical protein SY87_26710 [Burkholderia pseudomallei]|nr:hypothetical protein SY87_26710 [Burkholderia pseudomallei]